MVGNDDITAMLSWNDGSDQDEDSKDKTLDDIAHARAPAVAAHNQAKVLSQATAVAAAAPVWLLLLLPR